MLSMDKQRVFIALFLMAFLCLGSVAAYARDTNGSDRMVKGAAIGAAVGAVTQVVRGRRGGVELLKGAAVGASVGAAAGAYSDYKQEKDARVDEQRRADYYQAQTYRGYQRGRRGYRAGNNYDFAPNYARQGRVRRAAHRHNGRCRH
jgi:uncharacterized membrane protein YebE (DUF533 family)